MRKTFNAFRYCRILFLICAAAYAITGQTDVRELVDKLSDTRLQAVGEPLIGDFNKDGIQDIATSVLIKLEPELGGMALLKQRSIKVEYLCHPSQNCCDEIDFDQPALLILHNAARGWRSLNAAGFKLGSAVLLRGRANVFAFQKKKVPNDLGFTVKKDRPSGSYIEFPTEASEGILRWRGGRYTWFETEP